MFHSIDGELQQHYALLHLEIPTLIRQSQLAGFFISLLIMTNCHGKVNNNALKKKWRLHVQETHALAQTNRCCQSLSITDRPLHSKRDSYSVSTLSKFYM